VVEAEFEEGGVLLTFFLIRSKDGRGELGGGGVNVELLLDGGLYSIVSSSSSGDIALWL
jgi:hypothetical protein